MICGERRYCLDIYDSIIAHHQSDNAVRSRLHINSLIGVFPYNDYTNKAVWDNKLDGINLSRPASGQ